MPRKGRLLIPGACYHIIGRGFERRDVFSEPEHKQDFLRRLEKGLFKVGAQCFAWALMSNHYHLLIRASEIPLGKLMSSVLTGFACYYNRQHDRSGYVFQNRFQSILCDEQSYFLELVRYIHLNPVRAKQLESLDELDHYPWTGHAAVMGNASCGWLEVDELLGHFASTDKQARYRYREFIGNGLSACSEADLSGGGLIRSHQGWENLSRLKRENVSCIGDERILGTGEFVRTALNEDELKVETYTLRKSQGWSFTALSQAICVQFGVSGDQLLSKSRAVNVSDAKSMLCYWAVEELGLTVTDVAKELNMSHQGASKRVGRGREISVKRELRFDDLKLSC